MKIGVVNNKGGVLKTTLSTNLAASLSLDGKKVIIVDLDGQGNVIATFGKKPDDLEFAIMDFLKGKCYWEDILIKKTENLHILPGNDELNYFDFLLNQKQITQSSLKMLINKLDELYDYVIIDTPPAMSVVVATTLSIVDVALVPFEPDQYATLGLKRIINAAKEFKEKNNHNMKIVAIPTKVNTRVTIHNDIIEQSLKPKLKTQGVYVTSNFISSTTKSTAAVGYERVPIVMSVFKSKYQDEYHNLKKEILNYVIFGRETSVNNGNQENSFGENF
ncbi:ParA family protein [Malacoplasma penetrans]|uniref:ParA family protein n=1 Tax=Malacoplasma penetrans TaxID=28227 RepID=UPI001011438B|nr:ParA family protein [Malacoplasma penetrans]RXY97407.1 ParA family protein [Malacoplasma penetrans]